MPSLGSTPGAYRLRPVSRPSLRDLAAQAGVSVCEATYLEADPQATDGHGHLTARMAGQVAAEAGAHASESFGGEVSVAQKGEEYGPRRITVS